MLAYMRNESDALYGYPRPVGTIRRGGKRRCAIALQSVHCGNIRVGSKPVVTAPQHRRLLRLEQRTLSVAFSMALSWQEETNAPAAKVRRCNSLVYSITSSARTSRAAGTVTPSALAVLRLMNSSTFVVCSTGKSAGFTPLSHGRMGLR
jgi:hypothetical protein